MKTTTAGMDTHLAQTVTSLATCWKVTRRDGVEFFFTDHDVNISFGGDTYVASAGYSRTSIANNSALSVDNLDVQGFFDDASITEADLRAGLFDFAEVRIFVVDWSDPDTNGAVKLRRGTFGEVVSSPEGIFRTELRGLTQHLAQNVLELYSPECRADLGDSRCKVPIYPAVLGRNAAVILGDFYRVVTAAVPDGTQADYENRVYEVTTAGTTAGSQPTYDTTIGNPTTDGTAVLTARDAFMRDAVVASIVTQRRVFSITVSEARAVDGWFDGGALTWETGDNAGRTFEVKQWAQTGTEVSLFLLTPFDIQVGDALRIYAGCDKRRTTCISKFANILNYRGEPFVPGTDEVTSYPDAR